MIAALVRTMAALMLGAALAGPAPSHAAAREYDFTGVLRDSFLDIREELRDAGKAGKHLVLYFEQENCPICRSLVQANFSQREIVGKLKRSFHVITLDVWGARDVTLPDGKIVTEKVYAQQLGVRFTPVLLFLDDRGGIALRTNGYMPPAQFGAALDFVAGRRWIETDFATWLRARPLPAASKTLHDQPFFDRAADLRPAAAGGRPTVLLFEHTECTECDALHAEGFTDPGIRKLVQALRWVRLPLFGKDAAIAPDGTRTTAADLARRYKAVYAPTAVFLDAAGREVLRFDGYPKAFHFTGALEFVSSGAHRDEPDFLRFLQRRAERLKAQGIEVKPFQ